MLAIAIIALIGAILTVGNTWLMVITIIAWWHICTPFAIIVLVIWGILSLIGALTD